MRFFYTKNRIVPIPKEDNFVEEYIIITFDSSVYKMVLNKEIEGTIIPKSLYLEEGKYWELLNSLYNINNRYLCVHSQGSVFRTPFLNNRV